jgi:hypothetical protein
MPESLSTTEVQEIVTNRIQQCIGGCSASFSCGSSTVLPFAPTVTLLGEDGSAVGKPILLHQPAIGCNNRKDIFKKQESQLEPLMSTMPRAAFGKGGDTVVDTSVRDALREYIIRYLHRFVGIKCFLTTTCLVYLQSSTPQSLLSTSHKRQFRTYWRI